MSDDTRDDDALLVELHQPVDDRRAAAKVLHVEHRPDHVGTAIGEGEPTLGNGIDGMRAECDEHIILS